MRPRHGAFLDPACETVAHHQVIAFAQTLEDWRNLPEVVALVGVAHDDVAARGSGDAAADGGPISGLIDQHHLCTVRLGDLLRTVGAPVVRDEDLRLQRHACNRLARTIDASPDGLCLVEAWHEDRDLEETFHGAPRPIRTLRRATSRLIRSRQSHGPNPSTSNVSAPMPNSRT